MHHPVIVLLFLVMIFLFAPLIGQGVTSAGSAIGTVFAAAPGLSVLTRLTAPAMVVTIILFGALLVAVIKVTVG
jgi:hypothetical protein